LCPPELKEVILAQGHENVLVTHRTTFEITKEPELSKSGTCIIVVSADKALKDLSPEFKENLRKQGSRLTILIEAGDITEMASAWGNPRLILTHSKDIVVRKSDYICNRTLAVQADKAACDFSRNLVERLRDPLQKVKITLTVQIHDR